MLPVVMEQYGVTVTLGCCIATLVIGGIVCRILAPETSPTTVHQREIHTLLRSSQSIGLVWVDLHLNGAAFAAPETFVIDGAHTTFRFSYSHFGFSTQLSRFNKTRGKIVLDREADRLGRRRDRH